MISQVEESALFDGVFEPRDWITSDEATELWKRPLHLFRMANALRETCCGDDVSFVINRNINFTNRCVGSCKFCAFRRSDGYMLTDEEILTRAAEAERFGATEICLQGGLAPGLVLEDYCHLLELIRTDFPKIHLHAYSPMEVFYMSQNSGISFEEAIRELKRVGLGSMPGTAAEILVDSVRRDICPSKLTSSEWRKVIVTAHRLGVPSTSTMLYGHVESFEDRIQHMEVLREIQAETGGFTEFVLLPFMSHNNELGPRAQSMTYLEHLKMHALARVFLHPLITNIQASWVKMGRNLAASSTQWGVNDLGGTLMEENISRTAGSLEAQCMTSVELKGLIEGMGKRPVQRDTLYRRLG